MLVNAPRVITAHCSNMPDTLVHGQRVTLALSEMPDAKSLWLLSTNTGIAPFLSILKTEEPRQRFERIVLAHAVRHADELAYGEAIRDFAQQHGE